MTAALVMPELPEGITVAEAAVLYAAAGRRPIPLCRPTAEGCGSHKDCNHPGKRPLIREWKAGQSPEEVRQWGVRTCNVGLAMGHDRLIALDVDGAVGRDSLTALEAKHGPLPETATSVSGREDGGEHRFFHVPDDLDLGAIKNAVSFRPGLDVRAAGGQVVAPPSRHASGQAYRWTRTGVVAELPRWLFDVMTAPKVSTATSTDCAEPPRTTPRTRSGAGRPTTEAREKLWAEKMLANRAAIVASAAPGTRNATARDAALIAGHYAPRYLSVASIEREVFEACERNGLAREDSSGTRTTIQNAIRDGMKTPKAVELPADETPAPRGAPSRARSSAPIATENDQEHAGQGDEGPADWRDELQEDRHGPRKNLHNVASILAHDEGWPGCLAYDEFADRLTLLRCPPSHAGLPGESFPRAWRDKDDVLVARWLQRTWQIEAGPELVGHAAVAVATENSVHPVREYLEGLTWDGVPRLSTWLSRHLGAEPSAYTETIGACTLRAAVARIYKPGCKVDTVLVLQGEQSARKSSALRVLFRTEFFTDDLADFGSKDAAMQLRGAWCIEVAELASTTRVEIEKTKAFVSRQIDRYRASYGRHVQEQPRQCVFIGTTNADTYLRDETGNRRFWPVACAVKGPIDLEGLARDRDQLWAEAVATFKAGKRWHLDPVEDAGVLQEATAAQESVRERDAWEDTIRGYLSQEQPDFISVGDLLAGVGIELAKRGPREERRVVAVLRGLGWRRGQRRVSGGQQWGYRPNLSATTPELPPVASGPVVAGIEPETAAATTATTATSDPPRRTGDNPVDGVQPTRPATRHRSAEVSKTTGGSGGSGGNSQNNDSNPPPPATTATTPPRGAPSLRALPGAAVERDSWAVPVQVASAPAPHDPEEW